MWQWDVVITLPLHYFFKGKGGEYCFQYSAIASLQYPPLCPIDPVFPSPKLPSFRPRWHNQEE